MLFIADAVWNKMVNALVSIWWVLRGRMIINVPWGLHDVAILGCETCPIPMPQSLHGSWNGWKWVGVREMGWCPGDRLELWEVQI